MYKYSYEHSSTINKILYYFTWPIYQTTFKYIKTVHNICAPRTPAKFFNFEVPDKITVVPFTKMLNSQSALMASSWIKNKNVTNFPKIHDFLQDLGIIMHEV